LGGYAAEEMLKHKNTIDRTFNYRHEWTFGCLFYYDKKPVDDEPSKYIRDPSIVPRNLGIPNERS